ncbi:MAG TPA: cytochrome c3 family protein [Vicinamibacterales bacterium]|jgi:predicted CXXCH cytochrome family protein
MMIARTFAALAICMVAGTLPLAAQTPDARARAAFQDDVHAAARLTCSTCHGGQAAPSTGPPRTQIATLCAKCHSDPGYMRQYDPQVRVDQFAQYLTSAHGQQMAKGEDRVATCSDCHGAHGIKRVTDARSPVAPLNLAATCARCHADPARMAPFNREPTPNAEWSASVHAAALVNRGDTSAPTCSSCHGSHGAAPPGVSHVVDVCSQCHVREAELFRASPKKAIFEAIGQAECLVCHGNHRIESPQDAWIGLSEGAVCSTCHDENVGGAQTIKQTRQQLDALSAAMTGADGILTRAERAGMLVDEGRLALREAHEHRINARVMVHAFAGPPLLDVASRGLAAAQRANDTGTQALRELQSRRRGLGIATVFILGFLVTLWLKIRSFNLDSDTGTGGRPT